MEFGGGWKKTKREELGWHSTAALECFQIAPPNFQTILKPLALSFRNKVVPPIAGLFLFLVLSKKKQKKYRNGMRNPSTKINELMVRFSPKIPEFSDHPHHARGRRVPQAPSSMASTFPTTKNRWRIKSLVVENWDTPGKINMEPENTPLEKENHLPNHHFQVLW